MFKKTALFLRDGFPNVLISDYRLWDFVFELGPKYECFVSKKLLSLGYWALELLLDHEYWIFATGSRMQVNSEILDLHCLSNSLCVLVCFGTLGMSVK